MTRHRMTLVAALTTRSATSLCRCRTSGVLWSVFENDPVVDCIQQQIVCRYLFEAQVTEREQAPRRFTETLIHHYLLPEQLLNLLQQQGFEVRVGRVI